MTSLLDAVWQSVAEAALLATPVLILVAVVCRWARRGNPALRHCAWLAILVGVAALPVLPRVVTPHDVVLPVALPLEETPAVRAAGVPPLSVDTGGVAVRLGSTSAGGQTRDAGGRAGPDLIGWLPWLWLAGLSLSLVDIALGVLGLSRLRRRAQPSPWSSWQGVPVLFGEVRSPVTFGILRPVVLLPRTASTWSASQRCAVLQHEVAHVRRRDWGAQLLGRLICAVFWFHPLIWFARAQMAREAEEACDQMVLQSGVKPSDYAHQLLDVAVGDRVPVYAVPMLRRPHLPRRIRAILADPLAVPRARSRAAVLSGIALLIGPLTLVRPTLAEPRPPVFPGEKIAQARWGGGGWTAGLFVRGVVNLRADDRDVERLEPGGYFLLITRNDTRGTLRHYHVSYGARGVIWRNYAVNGEGLAFDDEARQWLAALLPQARHRLRGLAASLLEGGRVGDYGADAEDLWGSTLSGPRAVTRDGGGSTVLGRLPSRGDSGAVLFFKGGDVRWSRSAEPRVEDISDGGWLVAVAEDRRDGSVTMWQYRSVAEGRPTFVLWENGAPAEPDSDSERSRVSTLARLAGERWLHAP